MGIADNFYRLLQAICYAVSVYAVLGLAHVRIACRVISGIMQGVFQCFHKSVFFSSFIYFILRFSLGLALGLAQIQTAQGARTLQKV